MVREHPLRNRTQRKVEPLHEAGTQPAIPVGLGMALVHNQHALTKFSALTDEEKRAFIAGDARVCRPVRRKLKNTPAAFLQRGYLHVSNRMSVQSVSAL